MAGWGWHVKCARVSSSINKYAMHKTESIFNWPISNKSKWTIQIKLDGIFAVQCLANIWNLPHTVKVTEIGLFTLWVLYSKGYN